MSRALALVIIYLVTGLAISAVAAVPGVMVRRKTLEPAPMTKLGVLLVTLFWPVLVIRWMIP